MNRKIKIKTKQINIIPSITMVEKKQNKTVVPVSFRVDWKHRFP